VALITFSLIFAGLSGFGLGQLLPNNTSSEEILSDNSIADISVGMITTKSEGEVEAKLEPSPVKVGDGDVKDDIISTGGDDTDDTYDDVVKDDIISTGGDET